MRKIWKFPLVITDAQTVSMPRGAKIISVQIQRDVLCLWALVETEAEPYDVEIHIFGTGNPAVAVDEMEFLGTVQTWDGDLVWHVFMKSKVKRDAAKAENFRRAYGGRKAAHAQD